MKTILLLNQLIKKMGKPYGVEVGMRKVTGQHLLSGKISLEPKLLLLVVARPALMG